MSYYLNMNENNLLIFFLKGNNLLINYCDTTFINYHTNL